MKVQHHRLQPGDQQGDIDLCRVDMRAAFTLEMRFLGGMTDDGDIWGSFNGKRPLFLSSTIPSLATWCASS